MSNSVNSTNSFDQSIETLQNKWLYKINQLQTGEQIKNFKYSNYKNADGVSNYERALNEALQGGKKNDTIVFECDEIEFQMNY